MKIKICGLQRLEDIEYINEVKVDYAGFIFSPASKRSINIKTADILKRNLSPEIKTAGVFVNQETEYIQEAALNNLIDIVQLHGDEDDSFVQKIKKLTGLKVIKAFRADKNLLYNIENTSADYVLIDSFDGKQFGGTGKTFNWSLIPQTNKEIFLAGGLNASNIKKAIAVNPYCLDINSGVETDGGKDREKIREIVKIIRKNI